MTFATGTPVSNTMVELYTLQRFLDPASLSSGYLPARHDSDPCFEQIPVPPAAGLRLLRRRFRGEKMNAR